MPRLINHAPEPAGDLITFIQSFTELRIPRTTAYRLKSLGTYPVATERIGGRWYVAAAAQRAYLATLTRPVGCLA